MAAFANGPQREPACTPDHHRGDDGEGRCSACNERLARPDLHRLGLLLIALSVIAVLVLFALVLWWARG